MTSRKPPSQRDSEYYQARQGRILQSMVPGSLQGRLANAAQTTAISSPKTTYIGSGFTTTVVPNTYFYYDTFNSPSDSYTLSFTPKTDSLHVYLNGEEQDEGTDYFLVEEVIVFTDPSVVQIGDVIDARYASDSVTVIITATTPVNVTYMSTQVLANNVQSVRTTYVALNAIATNVQSVRTTYMSAQALMQENEFSVRTTYMAANVLVTGGL